MRKIIPIVLLFVLALSLCTPALAGEGEWYPLMAKKALEESFAPLQEYSSTVLRNWPVDYGGCHVQDQKLIIYLTKLCPARMVWYRKLANNAPADRVEFRQAEHSFGYLLALAAYGSILFEARVGLDLYGLDQKTNMIQAVVYNTSPDQAEAYLREHPFCRELLEQDLLAIQYLSGDVGYTLVDFPPGLGAAGDWLYARYAPENVARRQWLVGLTLAGGGLLLACVVVRTVRRRRSWGWDSALWRLSVAAALALLLLPGFFLQPQPSGYTAVNMTKPGTQAQVALAFLQDGHTCLPDGTYAPHPALVDAEVEENRLIITLSEDTPALRARYLRLCRDPEGTFVTFRLGEPSSAPYDFWYR